MSKMGESICYVYCFTCRTMMMILKMMMMGKKKRRKSNLAETLGYESWLRRQLALCNTYIVGLFGNFLSVTLLLLLKD